MEVQYGNYQACKRKSMSAGISGYDDAKWCQSSTLLQKGNESEVVTGKEAGLTLRDYIKNRGWKVLGTNARKYDKFPISIRILSNNNPNMIQVNPDTEKDTFWYILKAATDSVIGFGMAEEISVDQLTSAIQNGTLGDYLRPVQVSQETILKYRQVRSMRWIRRLKFSKFKRMARILPGQPMMLFPPSLSDQLIFDIQEVNGLKMVRPEAFICLKTRYLMLIW